MNQCVQCKTELDYTNKTMCVKCGALLCDECSAKNNYKCEKCEDKKKIKLPKTIRRSYIEDYVKCPYHFKLHVIDGNEVPQNPLAHLGSDLHDLYEHVQRGDIELEQLDEQTEWLFQSYEELYEENMVNRMRERSMICNNSFKNWFKNLKTKAKGFEERINFPIAEGLPEVSIAYDRLEEDEKGNLHISDFKTGKIMSGKKLTTDLQVSLYLKAIGHKYGKMPKSFTLLYVGDVDKKGKYKERVFTSIDDNKYVCKVGKKEYIQDVQEQLKRVQKIFSQIKQGHFSIPAKPDYFMCKTCHFKEIGMCASADTQNWLNINEERSKYGW